MPVYQKDGPGTARAPTGGMMHGASRDAPAASHSQRTEKQTVSYSPEIPRRAYDLPSAPRANSRAAAPAREQKSEHHRKLLVGHGIHLSGKIGDCEHLVVQGHVEIDITDCTHIEIAPGGTFKGSATVEEATIGGKFDGELNVTGMLRLRGTGVVTGNVHYGELIVEAGGQLKGTSEPTEDSKPPRKAKPNGKTDGA